MGEIPSISPTWPNCEHFTNPIFNEQATQFNYWLYHNCFGKHKLLRVSCKQNWIVRAEEMKLASTSKLLRIFNHRFWQVVILTIHACGTESIFLEGAAHCAVSLFHGKGCLKLQNCRVLMEKKYINNSSCKDFSYWSAMFRCSCKDFSYWAKQKIAMCNKILTPVSCLKKQSNSFFLGSNDGWHD